MHICIWEWWNSAIFLSASKTVCDLTLKNGEVKIEDDRVCPHLECSLATGISRLSITIFVLVKYLLIYNTRQPFDSQEMQCNFTQKYMVESRSRVWIYWWRTCFFRFARYKRLSSTANMQYFLTYQLIVRKHFVDEIIRLSTLMWRNTQAKPYTNGRVAIARSSNFAVA